MKRALWLALSVVLAAAAMAAAPLTEQDLTSKSRTYTALQALRKMSIGTCTPDPPAGTCTSPAGTVTVCVSTNLQHVYGCVGGVWGTIGNVIGGGGGAALSSEDTQILFFDAATGTITGAEGTAYSSSSQDVRIKILNGANDASMYATAGTGSDVSPWTGWEASVQALASAGMDVVIPAGRLKTTTGITLTGRKIALRGTGADKSMIECAGTASCLTVNNDFASRFDMSDIRFVVTSTLTNGHCAIDASIACDDNADCDDNAWDYCEKAVVDVGNEGKYCSSSDHPTCVTTADCVSGTCQQGAAAIDGMSIRDIKIVSDTQAHAEGAVALKVTNANSGVIQGLVVGGDGSVAGQPAGFAIGLDLFPGEKQNRGNIQVIGGDLSKIHTCARTGYGAIITNNIAFYGTKCVSNLATVTDSDIGFDLYGGGSTLITLDTTHSEAFGRGIQITGSRGNYAIRNHWFGHVAGTGGSIAGPNGIGLNIRKGFCHGTSSTVPCDLDSACASVGDTHVCSAVNMSNLELTGSRFDVSATGGICSWCSNAPSTTCAVDADCGAGTCNLTCGMGVHIGTTGMFGSRFCGNATRGLRLLYGKATHCSVTTATECLRNSECPTNEQCISIPTAYQNTEFCDGDGYKDISRSDTSGMSGALLRLGRANGNRPEIAFEDRAAPFAEWKIGGDDTGFAFTDSNTLEVFKVGESASPTVQDGSVAVNISPSSGAYEIQAYRPVGSARIGPMLRLQRADGDGACMEFADAFGTTQVWRVCGNDTSLSFQNTTDGTTPFSIFRSTGRPIFPSNANCQLLTSDVNGLVACGNVSVNVNGSAVVTPNFNDTTPAAPTSASVGGVNVKFQSSGVNTSAYVKEASLLLRDPPDGSWAGGLYPVASATDTVLDLLDKLNTAAGASAPAQPSSLASSAPSLAAGSATVLAPGSTARAPWGGAPQLYYKAACGELLNTYTGGILQDGLSGTDNLKISTNLSTGGQNNTSADGTDAFSSGDSGSLVVHKVSSGADNTEMTFSNLASITASCVGTSGACTGATTGQCTSGNTTGSDCDGSGGNDVCLTINGECPYNAFPLWRRGDATYDPGSMGRGYNGFYFVHTPAGASARTSARYEVFNETGGSNPFLSTNAVCTGSGTPVSCCTGSGTGTCGLTITEHTPSIKQESGIKFYGSGSTFDLVFQTDHAFDNVYQTDAFGFTNASGALSSWITPATIAFSDAAWNGTITDQTSGHSCSGGGIIVPDAGDDPVLSGSTNKYVFTALASKAWTDAEVRVTIAKPGRTSAGSNTAAPEKRLLNTYGNVSTQFQEVFLDENYRLPTSFTFTSFTGGSATITGQFDSTLALATGSAQVYLADASDQGALIYPQTNFNGSGASGFLPAQTASRDYSGFTGNQVFPRAFQTSSTPPQSNGVLRICGTGIGTSDLSVEGAADKVAVSFILPTQTQWSDALCAFDPSDVTPLGTDGECAGTDTVRAISVPCTGVDIPVTFGGKSTANSGNRVYVRVTFTTSGAPSATQKARKVTLLGPYLRTNSTTTGAAWN